jgi:hypothetical protein
VGSASRLPAWGVDYAADEAGGGVARPDGGAVAGVGAAGGAGPTRDGPGVRGHPAGPSRAWCSGRASACPGARTDPVWPWQRAWALHRRWARLRVRGALLPEAHATRRPDWPKCSWTARRSAPTDRRRARGGSQSPRPVARRLGHEGGRGGGRPRAAADARGPAGTATGPGRGSRPARGATRAGRAASRPTAASRPLGSGGQSRPSVPSRARRPIPRTRPCPTTATPTPGAGPSNASGPG